MVPNWQHRCILTAKHRQKGASERHIAPSQFPEASQNGCCEYCLPVCEAHPSLPHKPLCARFANWEFKVNISLLEMSVANSLEGHYLGDT